MLLLLQLKIQTMSSKRTAIKTSKQRKRLKRAVALSKQYHDQTELRYSTGKNGQTTDAFLNQDCAIYSTTLCFFRNACVSKIYVKTMMEQTISRFTCLKIAVIFTGSFQAVLCFFLADSRRKKGLSANKMPLFLLRLAKKERAA